MPLRFALIIIMCLSLSLTGCWDQNLLKNITLVLTSSIDQGENDCVQMSITYRKVQQSQGTQQANTGTYITTVLTTEAPTIRKARTNFSRSVDQKIDLSKMRVMLIGEEFSKTALFPT